MPDAIERLRGLVEKATRGKWSITRHCDNWTDICFEEDGVPCGLIASVARWSSGVPGPAYENDANAALIVAAVNALPALLAVAKAAKATVAGGCHCCGTSNEPVGGFCRLRDALANLETHQ